MDSDLHSSMPTLGLVGSTGRVEKPEPERAPCLVAVSSMDTTDNDNSGEKDVGVESKKPEDGSQSVEQMNTQEGSPKRERLTTTLLIFKRPSEETSDYMIANPQTGEDSGDEFDYHRRKKKKKKNKKSKESTLSMSRSYAQELLAMQKSIKKLTSRYQPSILPSKNQSHTFDDRDRRRRTQSTSYIPSHESSFSGLKSPPLSAPILGQLPSFSGFKSKSNLYNRRRQMSTGSNIATENTRRRFTRKKRWESEETRSSGVATPTIETPKKSHLSENNVWAPMDDYRLLVNMVQTKGNLEHVFAGTKFSCFYTFDEVERRWETLLYDTKAGPLSQQAISNLHPFMKSKIISEALFSEDEEILLRTIKNPPGGSPDLSCFTTLLEANPEVFLCRTARQLQLHWMDMKTFHLLDGQDVRDYKDPFNLFEFQDSAYLASIPDTAVVNELQTESRLVKRQIRQLEEEIESWHCMQELVVSDGVTDLHSIFSLSEFDDQTYAILRGKQVRYCMRSKEILLGRHSTNNKVDADLTLEGASGKVSRRQAIIQMRGFGEFFLINQGRHSIFVDSLHVPYGGMAKLSDGCVIQITHINLIFKINEKLMRKEISLETNKELMNARLKSYDTLSTPSSYSALKPPGLASDTFASPSNRFKSPRKRSVSSASGSPAASPSGLSKPAVPSTSSGLNSSGSILPFSTADLTIRQTSQPHSSSPFLIESSKNQSSKAPVSDSDVFKKPAPVSSSRSTKSSPARTPSSTVTSDPNSASAFATVGTSQMLPNSNIYTTQNAQKESGGSAAGGSQAEAQPAMLSPASSLIDYSKLGLSSDITVTQRLNPSGPTLVQNPDSVDKPPASTPSIPDEDDEPPLPSLGLVR